MRKIVYVAVLLLHLCVYSQVCGTKASGTSRVPFSTSNSQNYGNSNESRCVNVFFHIVRNSNGTNAFTLPDVNDITRHLNNYLVSHGIHISNVGSDFIDNTSFVQIYDGEQKTLASSHYNESNAINYYIVKELWNTLHDGYITGVAIDIPSNALVIRADRVLQPTSPHELGHCLNLWHTHHGTVTESGSDTGQCAELAPSQKPNCKICGDYVCDTPADPKLNDVNVNTSCVYIGEGYSPDTRNIMSYSRWSCRTHFTSGQGQRMRNALAGSSVLRAVSTVINPSLAGPSSLTKGTKATYTLENAC